MDWWRSPGGIRQRVEAELGELLTDAAWKQLRMLYDRLPVDEADAEELVEAMVERARDALAFAVAQGLASAAAPREPAPPFLPEHRGIGDRQAALSRVLAAYAARENEVVGFRRAVLGSRLLAPGKVEEWVNWQAERDGPPTRWLAVPLPPDVQPQPGETITFTLQTCRVEVETLRYVVPDDPWVRVRPVAAGGILGRLQRLSRRLADRYGWHEAQATTFVLTDAVPLVDAVRVAWRPGAVPALDRIVLEVDPVLTPAEVAAQYRQARAQALGKALVRPQSEKHRALAVFAVEHPDGTFRERMAVWNRLHPQWRYSQETNFGRDLRAAVRRLLGSPGLRWDRLVGDA
jgi:hypothetical protein